jgi:four helix bundle protein
MHKSPSRAFDRAVTIAFIAAVIVIAIWTLATSQLRRAAVSTASNIVEGCARDSLPDYLRFLDMAHGSAHEVEYQISLAQRLGFLSEETTTEVSALAVETCKVLNGLVRSLRSELL